MNTETIEETMTEEEIRDSIAAEGLDAAATILIYIWRALNLKTHIEGTVEDTDTGQKYFLSFKILPNE